MFLLSIQQYPRIDAETIATKLAAFIKLFQYGINFDM
jgi:hypothetical protein